jgi:hypothetical protein
MCAGCVSSFDSLTINAFGIVTAASVTVERIRRRRAPDAGLERAQKAWDRDASLMHELGLDPAQMLGARPTGPAPQLEPSAGSTPIPIFAGAGA